MPKAVSAYVLSNNHCRSPAPPFTCHSSWVECKDPGVSLCGLPPRKVDSVHLAVQTSADFDETARRLLGSWPPHCRPPPFHSAPPFHLPPVRPVFPSQELPLQDSCQALGGSGALFPAPTCGKVFQALGPARVKSHLENCVRRVVGQSAGASHGVIQSGV
jgi:hypothetical protein